MVPRAKREYLGGAFKNKSTAIAVLLFLKRCVPHAERDAHCVRDVAFGSDVRFAREKEYITSLCAKGAKHHYGEAITSLRR